MSLLKRQNVTELARTAAISADINGDPRLRRLNHYLLGAMVFWIYLAIYSVCSTSSSAVPTFCAGATVFLALQLVCLQYKLLSRNVVTDTFLFSSLAGLFIYCNLHPPGLAHAQFFFPVICLIASQLRGVTTAIRWYGLVIIITFFCYYPVLSNGQVVTPVDSFGIFVFNMLLSFSMMWLSGEAEFYVSSRSQEHKTLTDELRENTRLLELAEETAGVGHWRWNLKLEQFEFSTELKRILGITEGMVPSVGLLLNRFTAADANVLYEALQNSRDLGHPFEVELSFHNELNSVKYVSVRGFCQRDSNDEVDYVFGVIRDDTALKKATSRLAQKAKDLKKLASFDPLTGLANRFSFRRHLHRAVRTSIETRDSMALLVLDMDGFKEINDMLGHSVGDLVLKKTARRIRNVVQRGDTVARLGGDEFTVILNSIDSQEKAIEIGRRIVAEIARPMHFENSELHVGASVGVSICPVDTERSEELFTYADTAMYAAKFGDEDVVMYDPQMTEDLIQRKRVESKLSSALEREEFHLVYQPQVDMESGRINGFEALVRWNQNGQVVSPADFIPLLESTGRIIEVGNWIIQVACQQAAQWARQGHQFSMAINISPAQFREDCFVQTVINAIEANDLPPEFIDIEITETMLIADVGQTSEKLQQLREFGTKISVDDFGTGYSSLAYLKNFPIDRLKIDRTFIQDFPSHDDGMIASSIIVLGQSLDLEVLAEGVETQAQFNFLKRNLCNSFQGHFFSPAVSAQECSEMLAQQPATPLRNQNRQLVQ